MDMYGPRNELEALNSILQLVESSLSSACLMQKNVLQEFRDAIVDMMSQSGNKNILETTIVEGYNSDKEIKLLQWGENNGVKTRLEIACKSYLFTAMITAVVTCLFFPSFDGVS